MNRTNNSLFTTAIIMLLCINIITNSSLSDFKITKNQKLNDENTIFLQDTERDLFPSFSVDFSRNGEFADTKKVLKLFKKFDYEEVIFKNLDSIKEKYTDNLFEALKTQTRLKSLTLINVPSSMITKLSSVLTDRTSLTYFKFSRLIYDYKEDSNIEFIKAVKSMKNLETLILRETKITTSESIISLVEAISGLSNLTNLEISTNKYVGLGKLNIFKDNDAFKSLFTTLITKKTLTHLNLDGAAANDSQIIIIGDFLKHLTELKTLSLSHIRQNSDAEQIPNAFSSIAPAIASMSNLENLDLSGCSLSDEEAASIANSLANLHELKSLNLHSNYYHFSSQGVISIAKSLEDKVKLEKFSIALGRYETKSLPILALAKALTDKPNLKILQFETIGEEIETNVLNKFVSSLANSTKLQTLIIYGYIINDSNAETLANILAKTNIKILNLSTNNISIKGAAYILEKLGNSGKNIQMINFDHNKLDRKNRNDISIFKNSVVVSKNKLNMVYIYPNSIFEGFFRSETFQFTSEEYDYSSSD